MKIDITDYPNYYAAPGLKDYSLLNTEDPEIIIAAVCDYLKVEVKDVKKKWRKREVVEARQLCMWFLRKKTHLTHKSIGELFSHRDHTTVIHSCQTVQNLVFSDPSYKKQFDYLSKII